MQAPHPPKEPPSAGARRRGTTGGRAPVRSPRVQEHGLGFLGSALGDLGQERARGGPAPALGLGWALPARVRLSGGGPATSRPRGELFPAPGQAPRVPRPSIPGEPERRGGKEGGAGVTPFPKAPDAPALPPAPRHGGCRFPGPAAGDAVSHPLGKGFCGGGGVPRPYLSALVNLRNAWRRSWKER